MNQVQNTTTVETVTVVAQPKLSLFSQCVAVQNPRGYRRVSKYAPTGYTKNSK